MASVREAAKADFARARRSVLAVIHDAKIGDILAIFVVVPATLLGVELAIRLDGPASFVTRETFRFPVTEAGLNRWDLIVRGFLSSYGHHTLWPHLVENLIWYTAGMASLYALAIRTRRVDIPRFVLILASLCAPPVVALATLANPVGGSSMGFSGSVATVLGALPVVLFLAADRYAPVAVDPRWSAPPVFTVATVVSLNGALPLWVGVTTAVSTVGVTLLLIHERGLRTILLALRPLVRYAHPFAMTGTAVAFAGAFLLFVAITPSTNVAAHLAGYGLGYLVTLVVVMRRPARQRIGIQESQ